MLNVGQNPPAIEPPRDLATVREQIVQGGRILARFGILDAFGHVSARHPDHPDRFLMTKRIAPSLATVDDVLEFTFDSEPVIDNGTPLFGERFIHGPIYAARPDVNAVIHSHSKEVIVKGLVPGHTLKPVCHSCGFLGAGAPVFEIRDFAGPATGMLITSNQLGGDLAGVLGDASVVLMRRHGSTAVGSTVPQAVFRAVYSEENAEIQRLAEMNGQPTYLTDGEAAACEALAPFWLERSWGLWVAEES